MSTVGRAVSVAPVPANDPFPPSVTFLPPALPRTALQRARLEARLGPDVASRLTLMSGSAGSGKTTLTRSWLSTVASPWTWMTVDRALGHAERFWPSVVHAVQLATPEMILDAADAVESVSGDRADEIAQALVEDLLRWPAGRRTGHGDRRRRPPARPVWWSGMSG